MPPGVDNLEMVVRERHTERQRERERERGGGPNFIQFAGPWVLVQACMCFGPPGYRP